MPLLMPNATTKIKIAVGLRLTASKMSAAAARANTAGGTAETPFRRATTANTSRPGICAQTEKAGGKRGKRRPVSVIDQKRHEVNSDRSRGKCVQHKRRVQQPERIAPEKLSPAHLVASHTVLVDIRMAPQHESVKRNSHNREHERQHRQGMAPAMRLLKRLRQRREDEACERGDQRQRRQGGSATNVEPLGDDDECRLVENERHCDTKPSKH